MENIKKFFDLLKKGEFSNIFKQLKKIATRIYIFLVFKMWKGIFYFLVFQIYKIKSKKTKTKIRIDTEYPLAVLSLDYINPLGTKQDNSKNKIFNVKIDRILKKIFSGELRFLDLGCSGGGLVSDFNDLGYLSVGLEGSDYSLVNKRAEWKHLSSKNLFTADITKKFTILNYEHPIKFHLITAWEFLEHIEKVDLLDVFKNIISNLEKDGLFIASTACTSSTSINPETGKTVELHRTMMSTSEWKEWIENNFGKELEFINLPLSKYDYVRNDENSFLTYKRK